MCALKYFSQKHIQLEFLFVTLFIPGAIRLVSLTEHLHASNSDILEHIMGEFLSQTAINLLPEIMFFLFLCRFISVVIDA